MDRCRQCFNLADYCTCDSSEQVTPQPQTNQLFLPEGYTDPELHTGFYL